jgi:hypothetical protein
MSMTIDPVIAETAAQWLPEVRAEFGRRATQEQIADLLCGQVPQQGSEFMDLVDELQRLARNS